MATAIISGGAELRAGPPLSKGGGLLRGFFCYDMECTVSAGTSVGPTRSFERFQFLKK